MPILMFGSNVDPSKLSDLSRAVVRELLERSGNPSGLLTSLTRAPHDQARIMHDNLLVEGVEKQRGLYLAPGNKVIDVFVASARLNAADTIAAMEARIVELGPQTVSHHCADPKLLGVIDIAPSSLKDTHALIRAAKADPRVSKVLDPDDPRCHDPAVHLEIPQA